MEASRLLEITEADVPDATYRAEIEAELPDGEGPALDRVRIDWLLEKIADEEKEIAVVAEFTTQRMEIVRKHGEDEIARRRERVRWLSSVIRLHLPSTGHAMEREFGKKSLVLPHGTIGYKSHRESIVIVDQEKALAFAKANGLKTETKEYVGKTPLHEWVSSTGEEPDAEVCGFAVEKSAEFFYAKPSKDGEV